MRSLSLSSENLQRKDRSPEASLIITQSYFTLGKSPAADGQFSSLWKFSILMLHNVF